MHANNKRTIDMDIPLALSLIVVRKKEFLLFDPLPTQVKGLAVILSL